ncbi:rod-binding protein [Magnetospirillum molischianum]|uniref:Chemotactic signal-response protein cheL n=1 Tax=Magnetospirillum molischianum DSM 120 TaxID=1150626 RepID=H8FQK5_MAGML|nr:rod-binding protein [Magnetospirillum molischianum]CCG40643.1 Chemotactic signal-response protein cheL [Magnetospirillum molischianum DSM 120]
MSAITTTPSFDPALAAPRAPTAQTTSIEKAAKTAKAFESQFVSQMYQHMFEGVEADGLFGGGTGEKMFRSLLIDEYAKMTTNRPGGSGFGIAPAIQKMLLKQQEV